MDDGTCAALPTHPGLGKQSKRAPSAAAGKQRLALRVRKEMRWHDHADLQDGEMVLVSALPPCVALLFVPFVCTFLSPPVFSSLLLL